MSWKQSPSLGTSGLVESLFRHRISWKRKNGTRYLMLHTSHHSNDIYISINLTIAYIHISHPYSRFRDCSSTSKSGFHSVVRRTRKMLPPQPPKRKNPKLPKRPSKKRYGIISCSWRWLLLFAHTNPYSPCYIFHIPGRRSNQATNAWWYPGACRANVKLERWKECCRDETHLWTMWCRTQTKSCPDGLQWKIWRIDATCQVFDARKWRRTSLGVFGIEQSFDSHRKQTCHGLGTCLEGCDWRTLQSHRRG